jgi:hypothetical protein
MLYVNISIVASYNLLSGQSYATRNGHYSVLSFLSNSNPGCCIITDEVGNGASDCPAKKMSFSSLFKKASTFLGLSSPETGKSPPLDGEIIYCKNNVCVHPPVPLRQASQHHPGYLTIRTQNDEVRHFALSNFLILVWTLTSVIAGIVKSK